MRPQRYVCPEHSILPPIDCRVQPLPGFAEAGYRAITTLAFVAPEAVLPKVVEKISTDIKADDVQSLTDEDLGIWATPEGQTFVDGEIDF